MQIQDFDNAPDEMNPVVISFTMLLRNICFKFYKSNYIQPETQKLHLQAINTPCLANN